MTRMLVLLKHAIVSGELLLVRSICCSNGLGTSILAVRNAMLLLIDGNIRALGGSGHRGLFFCSQPMAIALPEGTIGTDPHEWRQIGCVINLDSHEFSAF